MGDHPTYYHPMLQPWSHRGGAGDDRGVLGHRGRDMGSAPGNGLALQPAGRIHPRKLRSRSGMGGAGIGAHPAHSKEKIGPAPRSGVTGFPPGDMGPDPGDRASGPQPNHVANRSRHHLSYTCHELQPAPCWPSRGWVPSAWPACPHPAPCLSSGDGKQDRLSGRAWGAAGCG